MKTLVLGGTRFIGLALVKELLGRGHEVAVLNRGLTAGALPEAVERLRADRNDQAGMQASLQGRSFDAVFDMSGYTVAQVQGALDALGGRPRDVHDGAGARLLLPAGAEAAAAAADPGSPAGAPGAPGIGASCRGRSRRTSRRTTPCWRRSLNAGRRRGRVSRPGAGASRP